MMDEVTYTKEEVLGRVVTCIWTGGEALSLGKRYEVVDAKPKDTLIVVIDDKGKNLWIPDYFFEMSGDDILYIKKIDFETNGDQIQVAVRLTDGTEWQNSFDNSATPKDLQIDDLSQEEIDGVTSSELQNFITQWDELWLNQHIHKLFQEGQFFSEFHQKSH